MSASAAGEPDDVPVAGSAPQPKPGKRAKQRPKRRFLWRWTRRLLITAVALRILLWLFLQPLADFGAGFAGLSVSWRSASLSLVGLSLTIDDLVVRDVDDAGDGPPLLAAKSLSADLSMRQLLQGNLSVVDVGIAGARVTLHQEADGALRLPKSWTAQAPVATPEPEDEADDDAPLDFRLPVAVSSTRLHDLQLDVIDHATEPPTRHTGKLDIDVADLGYTDRSGKVLVRLHAPAYCDELYLQANVHAEQQLAKADWHASVRGFRPHQWQLPREVMDSIDGAHVVDVRLDGRVQAEVLPEAPKVPALRGDCELRVALDGIERTSLDCEFGPTAVGGGAARTPFAMTFHCDRLVEALKLADGELAFHDGRTSLTAELVAERLTLARIRPMLEASGLQLPTDGVDLRAHLDTEFGESFSLDFGRLSVASDGDELLSLTRVAVRDLRTVDATLAIGDVEVVGPELPIVKHADGSLTVAGLRLSPPAAAAPAANAEEQPGAGSNDAPSDAAIALPQVRLGALRWSGARVTLLDRSTTPETSLSLDDVDVRADAIALGCDAPPGRLVATARLPGVGERLSAELQLQPRTDGLVAELQVALGGLTLQALAPMLAQLGIDSELTAGAFAFACRADVGIGDDGLRCDVDLRNLRFVDGDTTWCKLRAVEGRGVRVSADGELHAGTWTVTEPYVHVRKDAQGRLHAMGLQLGAAAPATATDVASKPDESLRRRRRPDDAPRRRLPDTTSPLLQHGPIELQGAVLAWRDEARTQRTLQLGLDAGIGANDASGAPIPLHLSLQLDRAMRSFDVDGALTMSPTRTQLDATLDAAGIDGGELQAFLPEGVSCSLRDGALHAKVTADVRSGEQASLTADLSGVQLRNGDQELFAVDHLSIDAPTTSPEVHVRALTLAGARALVTLTEQQLFVPGFALATAAPPAAEPATATPTGDEREGDEAPAAPQPAPPSAGAPLMLPKLRLDAVSLQLERLEFRDRRGEDRAPLVLQANAKLAKPWTGNPRKDVATPLQIDVDGACEPLGAKLLATLKLSPFELSPTIDLDCRIEGFDTRRLQEVMPALAEQLRGDAAALELRASLHAELDLHRRDPARFDFSRPFGGELVVDDVQVRDAATDRTFASVRSIDAVLRAVDPRSGAVLLRSLDIDEPVVNARVEADGLHAFGFVLPHAEAADGEPAPAAGSDAKVTPPVAKNADPGDGEFAVDHLRVLGVNFDFRDETTTPPTHLRLVDTDLELNRFSTRALVEPRPLSFTAAIRGGDIELERRIIRSSVLTGFVASAADALTGGADEHDMVQRPLVDQITAQGQVQLFPVAKGRVQLAVQALELAAFRGLAKQGGVDLADGVYDARMAVELRGHDGVDIHSRHVLTWLQLSEPPDGPITTYLRLPAPLPTVLFLLRNNDGEIQLPLNVTAPAEGLSAGEIAELAVEKLVQIIGRAVGSAGTRIVTSFTDPLLGGGNSVPDLHAEFAFEAGAPLPDELDEGAAGAFAELVEALADDETLSVVLLHELGAGDQPHAAELATPAADVIEATVDRLQQERRELEDERAPLANDVIALYAAGKSQEAIRRHAQLQAIDTHLGELETALREALDMLGGDNERRARRRSRAVAQALAEARLDAVTQHILARNKDLDASRVERRPGRGLPVDGVEGGGRVRLALRRRTADR